MDSDLKNAHASKHPTAGDPMLNRLFPKSIDNTYRGHWPAIWLLGLLLLFRLIIGVNSMINTHMVATTADGIPLDSYAPAAAQAVEALFTLIGLNYLVVGLLGVMVLIRYRGMIPLMFLLLLILQLGGKVVGLVRPIAKSAGAHLGSPLFIALTVLTVIGLGLSLLPGREPKIG